jgi:hypothetical protein
MNPSISLSSSPNPVTIEDIEKAIITNDHDNFTGLRTKIVCNFFIHGDIIKRTGTITTN